MAAENIVGELGEVCQMLIMSSIIAGEWSAQQSNVGDLVGQRLSFLLLRKKQKSWWSAVSKGKSAEPIIS
jgi:hypothetical protein